MRNKNIKIKDDISNINQNKNNSNDEFKNINKKLNFD